MEVAMREVQRLVYDGKRLFCPEHADAQLIESTTQDGKFLVLCATPIVKNSNHICMNSGEWPTREAMLRELESDS